MKIFLYIVFILLNSNIYSQIESDSVNYLYKLKYNSIIADWNIIISPIHFYPLNVLQTEQCNNKLLYSLYADSQINSGFNITLQSNVLLNQFKISRNWDI